MFLPKNKIDNFKMFLDLKWKHVRAFRCIRTFNFFKALDNASVIAGRTPASDAQLSFTVFSKPNPNVNSENRDEWEDEFLVPLATLIGK